MIKRGNEKPHAKLKDQLGGPGFWGVIPHGHLPWTSFRGCGLNEDALRSFLGVDIKMDPLPLGLCDASVERAEAGEEERSLVCLRKRCDYKAVRLMGGMQLLESVSLLSSPTSETVGLLCYWQGRSALLKQTRCFPA